MHSRRLLFVRLRPWSGLAPILAALLSLVALALLAFIVAFWPSGMQSQVDPSSASGAAPAHRSFEGSFSAPAKKRESGARTRAI